MKMKITSCALWANLGIAFAKRLSQPNATLHGQVLDARRRDTFFNDTTATDGGNSVGNKSIKTDVGDYEETSDVTIVIMSDRLHGLIPALGSIVTNSNRPVDILLIGKEEANLKAKQHFGDRVANFITMTLKDVEEDLLQNGGQKPIWTWDDWHASYRDDWQNKNTMHLAEWDGLETHSYTLNHLRFYLPYVSVLQNRDHVFFIDDDVLVQKDISEVIQQVIPTLDDSTALTCPCNIWGWNDECHHFDFHSEKSNIMETSTLYAGTPSCETTSDPKDACLPANWGHFLEEATPTNVVPESQTAWNFGFCLMHNGNWRKNNVTEKYEHAMRKNYESHAVPENSLAFGLGLPFISLAGNVACWNEGIMKIRDGFGFIEWSRYQSTFGQDFFSDIDVAHYTGPKKPWVEYSTIETNAINPWLDMMRQENMTIPPQLPTNQTTPLFLVLTGHRSGSEWVTNMLDLHPDICAAGETHKPENGFPTEAMYPQDWDNPLPPCSVKGGCTYNFALTEIQSMIQNAKLDNERAGGNTAQLLPSRCLPGYRNHSDTLLAEHRERLCNMIDRLDGNYTDQAILKLWVEAFQTENDAYTGCKCKRGIRIKGLKLMAGWLVNPKFSEFHETAFANSKIIRFKRTNVWKRFHSLFKAEHTGLWHARGKDTSTEVHETWDVDVNKMICSMKNMITHDQVADEWAKKHGSEVLWIDYEECSLDHDRCRYNMLKFLGVDPSLHPDKKEISKFASAKDPLALIKNRAEVQEALSANNFGHYIGVSDYTPIQVLVYETNSNMTSRSAGYVEQLKAAPGLNVTLIGQDSEWKGFGSKYRSVPSILDGMDEDSLIVLSDARDVIFNIHKSTAFSWQQKDLYKTLVKFRAGVEDILRENPGAVIISAEAQCCVSAMSHIQPGDLFALDGSRALSACPSGSPGCKWQGDSGKVQKWHRFMKELAAKRGATESEEIYLNAGLIAGRAGDLKKHIANLQIKEREDDQAVWTDYMYRNPESVVLDYSQRLFGSNQWKRGAEGCVFDYLERKDGEAIHGQRLHHKKTHTSPLFIHSPGKSDKCHDSMLKKLKKYGFFTSEDITTEQQVFKEIGGYGTRRSLQNYGDTVTVSLSLPVCNACGTAVSALESDEAVVDEFKSIACDDGGDCEVTFTGGECVTPCGSERMLTTQERFLQNLLLDVKEVIGVKIVGSLEDVRSEEEVAVAIQDNTVKENLETRIQEAFVASDVEATATLDEIEIIPPTSSPTSLPSNVPTIAPTTSSAPSNVPTIAPTTSSAPTSGKGKGGGKGKIGKNGKNSKNIQKQKSSKSLKEGSYSPSSVPSLA